MYPIDSIQYVVSPWWLDQDEKDLGRGSLIYAFIPHVEQVPLTLIPKSRKHPEDHDSAIVTIQPLRIDHRHSMTDLPVAALSLYEKEVWASYRAKKRPCLVLGAATPVVDPKISKGMPKRSISPTLLVAPYYGADKNSRAGYHVKLVERIRHAEYPQFFWDMLPVDGPEESILRFDHLQPIGSHYQAYQHTGKRLSDEALELVMDDWLQWVLLGGIPEKSWLLDFQEQIVSEYGE